MDPEEKSKDLYLVFLFSLITLNLRRSVVFTSVWEITWQSYGKRTVECRPTLYTTKSPVLPPDNRVLTSYLHSPPRPSSETVGSVEQKGRLEVSFYFSLEPTGVPSYHNSMDRVKTMYWFRSLDVITSEKVSNFLVLLLVLFLLLSMGNPVSSRVTHTSRYLYP